MQWQSGHWRWEKQVHSGVASGPEANGGAQVQHTTSASRKQLGPLKRGGGGGSRAVVAGTANTTPQNAPLVAPIILNTQM